MILTRTPFRVTLGGGGTDLPSFYEKHGGYVLACAMDKYMFVALNVPLADRLVRLHYTQSETVEDASALKHELAREALLRYGIRDAVEIASLADLPAGTGLGSSSSYLVGLLNAVRSYLERSGTAAELAEEACDIELNVLRKPIGKQDQYMAAFGGLTELRIDRSGSVTVERFQLPAHAIAEFVSKTHLYYTNVRRDAADILAGQDRALRAGKDGGVEDSLVEIKAIGERIGDAFRAADFDRFGDLMHRHWLAKKRLSKDVSVEPMERLYDRTRREFGVTGGKIAGAGGGGFIMLYCPGDGKALTEFMAAQGFERLSWTVDFSGSRVVSNLLVTRSQKRH
ncbi:MAG: galactokinase [Candidatus Eremiobacteraeota bacterium]|nr:galactokinase [Candidatus Eremiobacteraeota bacterium]MBV8332879.1 galactokinase [Candidatus Eremiobacteraeota bacterium]MBV8722745.1 galactokinase [Candidatus Eremiobacteraeota bacterium]